MIFSSDFSFSRLSARVLLLSTALSSVAACEKYVEVNLKLIEPCDQNNRALNGIRSYRVNVTEEGSTEDGVSFSPGGDASIQIALSTSTEVSVLAWTDENADSQSSPKSIGHTVLPGLPDDTPLDPVDISVMMGLVDSMGKVSSASEGGGSQCEELTSGVTVDGRHGHTATYIPSIHKVLIVGGAIWIADNQGGGRIESYLRTAELWDPATGVFQQLPELPLPTRAYHSATALPDGTVLVAGGFSFINQQRAALSSGFIFDPARMADDAADDACASESKEGCPFVPIVLKTSRALHTAHLLNDSMVVLVGGCHGTGCNSDGVTDVGAGDPAALPGNGTIEVYNIENRDSALAEGLITPRAMHAASVIASPDEGILVTGGVNAQGPVCTVELIRSSGKTSVVNVTSLSDAQRNLTICPIRHQQVSLSDRRVALIGGQTAAPGGKPEGLGVKTVQFWNSGAGIEAAQATLFEGRVGHTAHLLEHGSILVYGGSLATIGGAPAERLNLTTADVFVPELLAFPPEAGFDRAAAAQLPNNQIFVSGGHTGSESGSLLTSKSAYLYFGE